MPKFTVQYAGAVEVEATSSDDAIDQAWIEHGIRSEDVADVNLS